MKNKYVVIGVYFGNFPEWHFLWEMSALKNEKIDFMVFTDSECVSSRSNLKYIKFTMENFNALASEKLNLIIKIKRPYKLCDFKVVYGKIFEDYILDYLYWAHCDFDLFFGDIVYFCEKYTIEKFDRFLPLGHLAFYKNNKIVNNYYLKYHTSKINYKDVFVNVNKSYAFDEKGMVKLYDLNNYSFFKKRIFVEINCRYKRFRLNKRDKNYKYQVFYWENGSVFRAYFHKSVIVEKFMYIHFQNRKLKVIDAINEGESFYITNKGIFLKPKGEPTLDDMKKYNEYKGKIYELCEIVKFKLIKFFRKCGHYIKKILESGR